jgi:PIN domain nuclease of toxin-antitoxin system
VSAVVLDTHAALWWSFLPDKLSRTATKALDEADELVIPAIVFWETSLLVRKRRIELPVSAASWLRGLRTTARAKVAPLTAAIALRADALRMHDDPADRFIVATAVGRSLPLVTKDRAIRSAKLVTTIW